MDLLEIQGMPVKAEVPGLVDDGSNDSMLWAGLMCASGDTRSGAGIRACQSTDGRLWRCPDDVGKDNANSFSRDMALGFLMYVAASKDLDTFNYWLKYIDQVAEMCPDDNDNRCHITAPLWWQIQHVKNGGDAPWYLNAYLWVAAQTAALGYQLHLVGCHLLLNWQLTGCRNTTIGGVLHRRQPLNPFFQWLAGEVVVIPRQPLNSNMTQWAWERADSEEAWNDSMGWDFIFISNLLKT